MSLGLVNHAHRSEHEVVNSTALLAWKVTILLEVGVWPGKGRTGLNDRNTHRLWEPLSYSGKLGNVSCYPGQEVVSCRVWH